MDCNGPQANLVEDSSTKHSKQTVVLLCDYNHTDLSVLQVNLVAQDHKGEVLRVPWAGLDQELISPTVQGLEGVRCGHVKHQHAAVGSPVECHAQGLETLLASRVPDLAGQPPNTKERETTLRIKSTIQIFNCGSHGF